MRIALIHSHLNGRGGSQRYVIEIARELISQKNVNVDIFAFDYNPESCYPELTENLNICAVNVYGKTTLNSLKSSKTLIQRIHYKIKEIKLLKLLFLYFGVDYLISIYFSYKHSKCVSDLILRSKYDYDIVFAHEEPISVWAAIWYKKKKQIPIYWFCYDTIEKWYLDWSEAFSGSKLRRFLLLNLYFKLDKYIIVKYVDQIAVLDNNMAERVFRLYEISPIIRRGGVPIELFKMVSDECINTFYKIPKDKIVILSINRFARYKRIHDIFLLYNALPTEIRERLFFYINAPVSEADYYEECKLNFGDVIDSPNFILDTNYPISDHDMYNLYLLSDIFIFSSEKQTWGNAPLESIALNNLAIVSSGCGISEILYKISPNCVYNTGDIDQLKDIVINNIQNNCIKSASEIQKKYAFNNLNWSIICESYLSDFREIIMSKK
jgi:glycosyltransferase involved in cell wall biosynthesis